jgi:hypothetical protein
LLVRGCLGRVRETSLDWMARPLAVMSVLFAASTILGEHLLLQHWLSWAAAVAITLVTTAAIALTAGLPGVLRTRVTDRMLDAGRRLGVKLP